MRYPEVQVLFPVKYDFFLPFSILMKYLSCFCNLQIRATVSALRNTRGLPWPKGHNKSVNEDILDWLQAMFGFQVTKSLTCNPFLVKSFVCIWLFKICVCRKIMWQIRGNIWFCCLQMCTYDNFQRLISSRRFFLLFLSHLTCAYISTLFGVSAHVWYNVPCLVGWPCFNRCDEETV